MPRIITIGVCVAVLLLTGCAGPRGLRPGDKVVIDPGKALVFGEIVFTDNHKDTRPYHQGSGIWMTQETPPGIFSTGVNLFPETNGKFFGIVPAAKYGSVSVIASPDYIYMLGLESGRLEPGRAYYLGRVMIDTVSSHLVRSGNMRIDYVNSVVVEDQFEKSKAELLSSIAPNLEPSNVQRLMLINDSAHIPQVGFVGLLGLNFKKIPTLPKRQIAIAGEKLIAEGRDGNNSGRMIIGAVGGGAVGALAGAAVGGVSAASSFSLSTASATAAAPILPLALVGVALGVVFAQVDNVKLSKEEVAAIQSAFQNAGPQIATLESVASRVSRRAKDAGLDVQYVDGLVTTRYGKKNWGDLLNSSGRDAILDLSIKSITMKLRKDRMPKIPLEIQVESQVALNNYENKQFNNYENKQFMLYHLSEEHTVEEWAADDSKLLVNELDKGLEALTNKAMRAYFPPSRELH